MKKYSLITSVLMGIIILFAGFGVYASDLDDLESQQDGIKQDIQDTQNQIEEVTGQKNATMSELESMESQLEVLVNEISGLQAQLAQAEIDLAKQQEEYDIIEANLLNSQDSMKKRVNSIYKNGDISYMDIIFSSENVSDFLSSFVFFEKIVEQDQGIIDSIQENKRLAKEKLDQLQQTKDKIESVTNTKKNQEAALSTQQAAKQEVMASLESQEDTLQEVLGAFEKKSNEIAAEIQKITATSSVVYNGNGQFGWPCPGHSVGSGNGSKFGYRVHPVTHVYKLHTGVDIPAPGGTPILAAESGQVITASYQGAYGNCVIIDHGGSYTTLYGHMSRIGCSSGQSVSRGEVIGYVGTTGYSTGNHLHFEVRVNGTPQNPLQYT